VQKASIDEASAGAGRSQIVLRLSENSEGFLFLEERDWMAKATSGIKLVALRRKPPAQGTKQTPGDFMAVSAPHLESGIQHPVSGSLANMRQMILAKKTVASSHPFPREGRRCPKVG